MIDGHPVVWLWLLGLVVLIAAGDPGLLVLAALNAALAVTGLLARGPRSAAFLVGTGAALVSATVWLIWMLLLPGASARLWFEGALAATAVCLGLGLASQVVRAREWLSLASLTGPFAPAFSWLCCAGEACAEAASRRRQGRRTGGFTGWLTTVRDLAEGVPGASPRRLLKWLPADFFHLAAVAAITGAWLFRAQLGTLPLLLAFVLLPLAVALPLTLRRRAVAHA